MDSKEGVLALQDTACSEHENGGSGSEGKQHESLLVSNGGENVTEEKAPVAVTIKTLKYIRENKRKLAAMTMLWMAFLVAMMVISILAPFFPKEVSDIS